MQVSQQFETELEGVIGTDPYTNAKVLQVFDLSDEFDRVGFVLEIEPIVGNVQANRVCDLWQRMHEDGTAYPQSARVTRTAEPSAPPPRRVPVSRRSIGRGALAEQLRAHPVTQALAREAEQCQALTAKGARCRNKRKHKGTVFCGMHYCRSQRKYGVIHTCKAAG